MDRDDDKRRWVFGLCADWCGVCREWRTVFNTVAAKHQNDRFVWIDIEDQEDLVGEVDIETFPTLLVGNSDDLLFFGPTQPSLPQLTWLLAGLDGSSKPTAGLATHALFERLKSAQL